MTADAIRLLHAGGHSLVVADGTCLRTFDGRGVSDLYRLLRQEPDLLRGAFLADKVVGKGAAALMILGGVKELYAEVASTPALCLLREYGVAVGYGSEVPHIINRTRTGRCPLEERCDGVATPEECLVRIDEFMERLNEKK